MPGTCEIRKNCESFSFSSVSRASGSTATNACGNGVGAVSFIRRHWCEIRMTGTPGRADPSYPGHDRGCVSPRRRQPQAHTKNPSSVATRPQARPLNAAGSAAEREDVRKVVNLMTAVKMPYPESLSRNRAKTERVWLDRGGTTTGCIVLDRRCAVTHEPDL